MFPLPRHRSRYVGPVKPASWSYAEEYVVEDEVLAAARSRAEEVGVVPVGAGAGAALRFLASVLDARAVVEVGTGTGVSGLWMLRGMRADGVLTTVDIEAEHQRLARQSFTEAGIPAQRARTIAGAALDVLPRLTDGHYDLVFCDGDKTEYARVPQGGAAAAAPRRRGGLRQRPVARPGRRPRAARRGHRGDPRPRAPRRRARDLVPVLLPVGDGLLVAKKCGPPRPAAELLEPPRSSVRAARRGSRRQPSATATTPHSSMRTGALPTSREPGESAAPAVKVAWNSARAWSEAKT